MLNQFIELLEGAFVEQEFNSFARGHLTGGVLLLDARGATAGCGALFALAKLIEFGKFGGFFL
jgi:hypothetical protein